MKEDLQINEKIKLLPVKLKARADALRQLFHILKEVAQKSVGFKARIMATPFSAYRETGYNYDGNFWGQGELVRIQIDEEDKLELVYFPKVTGKMRTEAELFEIMVAFEEQEKRFLEWLSGILSPLSSESMDLTAELIRSIDMKLQEKAEKIYCYRYEGKVYPKTYLKFRKLERTEKATPAFSMEIYDYNTNKLLIHTYFNSTTEMIDAIKHFIEGFQYLDRKTTEEFPF